jgi:hypothetical protein
MLPYVCSFIVDVSAQNRQTTRKGKQEKKKTHTHTQERKLTKRKHNRKTQMNARKGNKRSEADSFRNIRVKHHTHLKMAM